ncbi:hypothetical protein GCM10007862_16420 [Dyella lipolytica]|nr:hypothetical protein GCM10007862_16420 [Dyella lipolytica]
MELGNKAIFCRLTDVCRLICLVACLLASGCNHAARKEAPPTPAPPRQTAVTGIPSCDTYLDSYLACHRIAGVYESDALQTHYQAMRASLLQDANDPHIRPYLAHRCMGLAQELNAVLKGRSCTAPATPPLASH